MEEIFRTIARHLAGKRDYFSLFSHYRTRMEGWILGEIIWLLHQPDLKSKVKVESVGKGIRGRRKPDLQLTINNRMNIVELKALAIGGNRGLSFYFDRQALGKEFSRLGEEGGEKRWLLVVAYPCWPHEWKIHAERAENEYRVRCTKLVEGKNDPPVLFSLWEANGEAWEETQQILHDEELMKRLKRADRDWRRGQYRKGDYVEWDKVKASVQADSSQGRRQRLRKAAAQD